MISLMIKITVQTAPHLMKDQALTNTNKYSQILCALGAFAREKLINHW
jgi:hypothetical protein